MRRAARLCAAAIACAGPATAAPPAPAPVPVPILGPRASADQTSRQLRDSERNRAALLQAQIDAAARLAAAQAEERALALRRVAAAARLREREEATEDVASRVADLAARERDAQARLDVRARDFSAMLPLIERLSRYPAETMLAVPLPPEQALRGAAALGFMARQLQDEAAAVKREKADIAALRAALDAASRQLAVAQSAQTAEAGALDAQIAAARDQQRDAEDAATEAARRGAAEAARADGLRAAITRIETERRDAEARAQQDAALALRQNRAADAARARARQQALAPQAGPGVTGVTGAADATAPLPPTPGAPPKVEIGASGRSARLTAPVAGAVVRGFGQAGDGGPATGLSYQAPPAARVVSPCGGRVVFSGPFRSYGQLMIVDCGANDLFVLAGLDRLDAHVGQSVQPGEPVGVMPNWDPRAAAARPSLYVELRHAGQPVNPAPFLRAKG